MTLKSSSHWLGLIKGGPGSGNFGHCGGQGGPGNPGGSSPAGECNTPSKGKADSLSDEFYEWLEGYSSGKEELTDEDWKENRFEILDKEKTFDKLKEYFQGWSTAKIDEFHRNFGLGLSFWVGNRQEIYQKFLTIYTEAFDDLRDETIDASPEDLPDSIGEHFAEAVDKEVRKRSSGAFGRFTPEQRDAIRFLAAQSGVRLTKYETELRENWKLAEGVFDIELIRAGGKMAAGDKGSSVAMRALMEARTRHLIGDEEEASRALKNNSKYWQGWLGDSQSPLGRWMAYVAAKELGAPLRMRGGNDQIDFSGEYDGVKDFLAKEYPEALTVASSVEDVPYKADAAMVRATWEVSQLSLRDYLDDVGLYRGIRPAQGMDVSFSVKERDAMIWETGIRIETSALQSATTQIETAMEFGFIEKSEHKDLFDKLDFKLDDGSSVEFRNGHMVIHSRIPKTKIFSVPSYGDNDAGEEEYVVLGGEWEEDARVYIASIDAEYNSSSLFANIMNRDLYKGRASNGK